MTCGFISIALFQLKNTEDIIGTARFWTKKWNKENIWHNCQDVFETRERDVSS